MKKFIVPLSIVLLFTLTVIASEIPRPSPEQAQQASSLVMTACTQCHDTGRICKNLGKKSLKKWDKTVSRMIRKGAALPEENKDLVNEYLFSLEPGSQPVCPE